MTDELMTLDEVAEYLRVPVPTIRWLRQEGRFAPAIKVGRRLVWDVARRAGLGARRIASRRRRVSIQRYTMARSRSATARG